MTEAFVSCMIISGMVLLFKLSPPLSEALQGIIATGGFGVIGGMFGIEAYLNNKKDGETRKSINVNFVIVFLFLTHNICKARNSDQMLWIRFQIGHFLLELIGLKVE